MPKKFLKPEKIGGNIKSWFLLKIKTKLLTFSYLWINCIAVIAPKKKIVGTARAWIDSQRTVKIGYVIVSAFVDMINQCL